jgi:hypothetical protein
MPGHFLSRSDVARAVNHVRHSQMSKLLRRPNRHARAMTRSDNRLPVLRLLVLI